MGIEMKPYYRPLSLESYEFLLKKAGEKARVLTGGDFPLNPKSIKKGEVLIDLQALKLDEVRHESGQIHIGGLCNLNMLLLACPQLPALAEAIRHQAGNNMRNTLSLASFLRAGRVGQSSPLLCALLALNAKIRPILETDPIPLAAFVLEERFVPIIAELSLVEKADFRFAQIGRTEMDLPQVCMGVVLENNGNLRVAVWAGKFLLLQGEPENIKNQIKETAENLSDAWAGDAFRRETLLVLFERLMAEKPERKEKR